MKDFAKVFYHSAAWSSCRAGYLEQHPLCEECLKNGAYKPSYIVHHKIYLTPSNINDPSITLNWDNLEAVCLDCHNTIHQSKNRKRYTVNSDGIITIKTF